MNGTRNIHFGRNRFEQAPQTVVSKGISRSGVQEKAAVPWQNFAHHLFVHFNRRPNFERHDAPLRLCPCPPVDASVGERPRGIDVMPEHAVHIGKTVQIRPHDRDVHRFDLGRQPIRQYPLIEG
jgi:hypothetical protein